MKPGNTTALRVVTALLCAAGGIVILLCCGIGLKFWSLIGFLLAIMGVAGAYFIAGRDYISGATPAGLAGVVAVFVFLPPSGLALLGVIMLFSATALAYLLYEVD